MGERAGTALSLGFVITFLGVIVALPIAALVWSSTKNGAAGFWDVVSSDQAVAALKLSLDDGRARGDHERRARDHDGLDARAG